jgi:hypothetical protein
MGKRFEKRKKAREDEETRENWTDTKGIISHVVLVISSVAS